MCHFSLYTHVTFHKAISLKKREAETCLRLKETCGINLELFREGGLNMRRTGRKQTMTTTLAKKRKRGSNNKQNHNAQHNYITSILGTLVPTSELWACSRCLRSHN